MDSSIFNGHTVQSRRILYTPSAFARSNLLYLQEAGTLTALQPHESRRENLSSFLCFLVLDGSGSLNYDGQDYPLQAGDCVFLNCRKPYSHKCSDSLWTLKWIHFYGYNMNGIYDKYEERGGSPCFSPDNFRDFSRLIDEVYAIAEGTSYLRDMQLYNRLTELLLLLMGESWNPGRQVRLSPKRQNLQEIKEYIDHNYARKLSLDELSGRFYINKYYLTRIFKEQFGMTLNSYLLQVRITHAKQLLRFTDDSIESIGARCGIPDAGYFARTFKKVEGTTPAEYRKKWSAPPAPPAADAQHS